MPHHHESHSSGLHTSWITTSVLALACLNHAGAQNQAPTKTKPSTTTPITDWSALIDKAQNHRRIMLRRATARKVAAGGAAAIPALRAYEKKHGRNALRMVLVSSYATSKAKDKPTIQLLVEWSMDKDFYWRSQALEALANRRLPELKESFLRHLSDPAHLMRLQAGRGLCQLGDHAKTLKLLSDKDPRVRLRIAICLIEENNNLGLPTLVESLREEASFLDYPWGQLGSIRAFKILRKHCGQDFGYQLGEPSSKNQGAIKNFERWVRSRLGEKWVDPIPTTKDNSTYLGGIEIRSCRNGDMFLRWTNSKALVFGLEGKTRVNLNDKAFAKLKAGPQDADKTQQGKVICDFLRWTCKDQNRTHKAPPKGLSAESAKWLESLAEALDKKGRSDLTKRILNRLDQFRSRRP